VIEVGSNDGYLLRFYEKYGIPVLGIDPAENIAPVAEANGVPTLCEFFGVKVAARLRREGKLADVIHGNNVFAHIADLNGFVKGMGLVLKDDGVIVIQVPYVRDMVEKVEFDTIYHEHLCYYSVTALARLFRRHGLVLHDVEHLPIHGGTLRIFVGHAGSERVSERVRDMLADEANAGLRSAAFYQDFGQRVAGLRADLRAMLHEMKRRGLTIIGYAASAKGTTLLNYCGIGAETLDYIVDRSTVKQGLYAPGTHLRIEPPERIAETNPDYALLLAWNHAETILEHEVEYRKRGGQFIVPVPTPRVV
jgi:SAM-dependent methyltransferase